MIKNCEANDNNIPEYIAKDIKKELDGEWICVFNSNDNINDFWFSEDNCYDYIKIMLNNYNVIILRSKNIINNNNLHVKKKMI